MRHLSRHTTLNSGYFGYFRSQKYLPRFRKIYSNSFCLWTFKNVLQQGGWPSIHLKCVTYYNQLYTSV